MFFILQNQPGFLGQLAFIVPSELKAEFVQTVYFCAFEFSLFDISEHSSVVLNESDKVI